MSPLLVRLLPLSLLLLAGACRQRTAADIPTVRNLEGTWLISPEESAGTTLVYRPNTYPFPPSRGRTGFAIGTYGRFEQFDLSPTDGLAGRPGSWVIDRDKFLQIHLYDSPAPEYTLEILSLDTVNQVLKVRRLP